MTGPATDPGRADAVTSLLRSTGELGPSERVAGIAQISGGWSRASYVATTDGTAPRDYIVRAKPPGGLLDTDLVAEFRVYEALQGAGIPVPRVFGLDPADDTPFEGPFFVMERMSGRAPNVFRGRDRAELHADWEGPRGIAADVVDNLALIHAVDAGDWLPRRSFHEAVDHWREIYESVRLIRDPILEEAFAWLHEREPAEEHVGLVHADYRPGNMLVDGGRVTAILDWELAYEGDVRFDLGYLALPRIRGRHLAPVDEMLGGVADQDWFLAEYESRTGVAVDTDTLATFSVLAAMMLASIMLTGVRAHADGAASDIRMAWNQYSMPGLRQQAVELMQW